MNFNAEDTSTTQAGTSSSYFGVTFIKDSAIKNFFQEYVLDVELVDMEPELTFKFESFVNETETLTATLEWSEKAFFHDQTKDPEELFESLFKFEMKKGSTLAMPVIVYELLDEDSLTF